MPRKPKMGKKRSKSLTQNTSIPYALRIQHVRQSALNAEREDAAAATLKLVMYCLNDLYGFGYDRLIRFAQMYNREEKDFYRDRIVQETNLNKRLEQLGFMVAPDGHILTPVDDNGNVISIKEAKKQGSGMAMNLINAGGISGIVGTYKATGPVTELEVINAEKSAMVTSWIIYFSSLIKIGATNEEIQIIWEKIKEICDYIREDRDNHLKALQEEINGRGITFE